MRFRFCAPAGVIHPILLRAVHKFTNYEPSLRVGSVGERTGVWPRPVDVFSFLNEESELMIIRLLLEDELPAYEL